MARLDEYLRKPHTAAVEGEGGGGADHSGEVQREMDPSQWPEHHYALINKLYAEYH